LTSRFSTVMADSVRAQEVLVAAQNPAIAGGMLLTFAVPRAANEARLVRYPHYHAGKVTFTYLADIWTADENGKNIQRLTVNRARDVYGRFISALVYLPRHPQLSRPRT